MIPDEVHLNKILLKVTYFGLFMNVMVPIVMLAGAAFLLNKNLQSEAGIIPQDDGTLQILFYALLAVAVMDALLVYYFRRKMPERYLKVKDGSAGERFERAINSTSLLIYSLNLSSTLYGLILVVLGAELEIMVLFAAITMIGYQLFRFRKGSLEQLWNEIDEETTY